MPQILCKRNCLPQIPPKQHTTSGKQAVVYLELHKKHYLPLEVSQSDTNTSLTS